MLYLLEKGVWASEKISQRTTPNDQTSASVENTLYMIVSGGIHYSNKERVGWNRTLKVEGKYENGPFNLGYLVDVLFGFHFVTEAKVAQFDHLVLVEEQRAGHQVPMQYLSYRGKLDL